MNQRLREALESLHALAERLQQYRPEQQELLIRRLERALKDLWWESSFFEQIKAHSVDELSPPSSSPTPLDPAS
jgi:hypothetical protein